MAGKKENGSKVMNDAQIDRQLARMGEEMAKKPRFPVRIPINPLNDPKDQVQYVGINGYPFWIPTGVTVMLPKCVIEVLEQCHAL